MTGIRDGISMGVARRFDDNIPLCDRFSQLYALAENTSCTVADMQ